MKRRMTKALIAVAILTALATVESTKANAQMLTNDCFWDTQYVVYGYMGPGTYIGRACYSAGTQISFTPWINVD